MLQLELVTKVPTRQYAKQMLTHGKYTFGSRCKGHKGRAG